MKSEPQSDLGFDYRVAKNGDVSITHNGRFATKLRGEKALAFVEKVTPLEFGEQQQWMARVTGNYKRGNERQAKRHPRNR